MSDIDPIYSELTDYAGRTVTFDELGAKTKRLLAGKAQDRAMDVLVVGANDIRNDAILGMRNTPEKSGGEAGRLYFKGWGQKRTKKGVVKKPVFHRASIAGWPPRPDSEDLLRSVIVDARFTEVEVGSILTNPAYPKWLEEGTRNIEARPWLWPAKTSNMPRIQAAMTRALREIVEEMTRSGK